MLAKLVDRLPAAEAEGDRYLAERITLAELVVGDHIPGAERQATAYAHDLPGSLTCWCLTDSAPTPTVAGSTTASQRGCASR